MFVADEIATSCFIVVTSLIRLLITSGKLLPDFLLSSDCYPFGELLTPSFETYNFQTVRINSACLTKANLIDSVMLT